MKKHLVRHSEQPGQIEAFEDAPLFAKVAGFVSRLHVDLGDQVRGPLRDTDGTVREAGQVLVELSVPELTEEHRQKEALAGQAQAEIRQAAAAIRVGQASQATARAQLEECQAGVERALADFERYRSEYERIRELADKGAVTRQLVDEKQNQFRAADAARNEVAARVQSARAGVVEADALLDKAQADAEAARARLRVAEAEVQRIAALLDYTRIRAPFDGVIAARHVHTGHYVHPGTGGGGEPLLVVIRTDVVRIFVDVPETDSVLAGAGSPVRIRIPALGPDSFPGQVTRTSWRLDSATRTLKVEIDVDNPDGRLRPGMYAYADLIVADRPDTLSVPFAALWTAEGQTACFTIDGAGKVSRRTVRTGIRAGDDVEILSGLAADDLVIGVNPSAFRDGQLVDVVQPEAGR